MKSGCLDFTNICQPGLKTLENSHMTLFPCLKVPIGASSWFTLTKGNKSPVRSTITDIHLGSVWKVISANKFSPQSRKDGSREEMSSIRKRTLILPLSLSSFIFEMNLRFYKNWSFCFFALKLVWHAWCRLCGRKHFVTSVRFLRSASCTLCTIGLKRARALSARGSRGFRSRRVFGITGVSAADAATEIDCYWIAISRRGASIDLVAGRRRTCGFKRDQCGRDTILQDTVTAKHIHLRTWESRARRRNDNIEKMPTKV